MLKRYIFNLDPGGASGTPCVFGAPTNITGDASFDQETVNITGAAGATARVQVTTYTNNNTSGEVLVNSSQVFLNNTFNIILDGSGNGSFVVRIQGDAGNTNTAVRVVFTITSVTTGQLGTGSSVTIQISKAF